MSNNITVTGFGKIAVKPDIIRISLIMTGEADEYSDALALSAKQTSVMQSIISDIKPRLKPIEETDFAELKTTSFSINAAYETISDENGSFSRRFTGYEYRHSAYIMIDANNADLGLMLGSVSECSVSPEISVSYEIKDKDMANELLIKSAVTDAASKARTIANAAGVTLGNIEHIDYSSLGYDRYARPMNILSAKSIESIDITPDDIILSDSVTVTWSIL